MCEIKSRVKLGVTESAAGTPKQRGFFKNFFRFHFRAATGARNFFRLFRYIFRFSNSVTRLSFGYI